MSTTESKKASPRQPKKSESTHIAGSSLVTELHQHEKITGNQYWYWVGALPSCPTDVMYLAGMGFPKMTEKVIPGNKAGGKTQRIPHIGHVCRLSLDKIDMIKKQLPQVVLRFMEEPRDSEPGVGAVLGDHIDESNRPRKGYPITIPTAEQIQVSRENKRSVVPYTRREHDEPGARYIFAQLCANQDHPSPESVYPEPLESTGIEWPESQQE